MYALGTYAMLGVYLGCDESEGQRMPEKAYWEGLRRELSRRVEAFPGVAGVAVLDLESGTRLGVNDDLPFPAASTIKVHLLTALFDLHSHGEVDVSERVAVEARVPGSGVLAYLDDRVELTWRDLANLMILVSDNTATNMIMDLIGLDRMERYLEQWGFSETRIVRKMQDHGASAIGGENLTTPREMAAMLARLRAGDLVDTDVAKEVLGVLGKPKVTPFSHGLPKGVPLLDKSGGMDRVRGDVAIVELPRRPFVMAVLTSFGRTEPREQMEWVATIGRHIFDSMAVLDTTNRYGQGLVSAPKGRS